MRKLGIAAKIYLAFGAIFLMAVIASSIGWDGFKRVTESQSSVIDQAIPGLRSAHRLSALNASIGAYANQLIRSSDEIERDKISSALFSEVEQLNFLLLEFRRTDFSGHSLESLQQTVADIEAKLRRQNDLVRQRILRQEQFNLLLSQLITTTEELNDLADSLVANAAATTTAITSSLYDMVEDDVSKPQLYNVFDRLVEIDLDAMERMYELRLRSANLNGLFNRVAKEVELKEIALLRQRTEETLSILKRRISEINDPLRRKKAGELLTAMEVNNGPLYVYGIFETRVALLQINDSLTQLSIDTDKASQALNVIVSELNTAGGTLINRVSTTAKDSLDSSRQLFGGTSILLLLVAAGILWWFIKRNVVRRLLTLQSATRAITEGDYKIDIAVEGHDELTDMARALRGFRNNAIDNQKLDEELRNHKTHLEDLVEVRSEELKQTNQKLSAEVENHAIARQKAEQASQAKTAFLATMSHELRTPLSGALGTLRLLAETPLEGEQNNYVQIINAANTSLLDIVNDILGYSQLDAGKLVLENKNFELQALLNNVVDLMSVTAREKDNQLKLDMKDDDSFWLTGDSGKLHQILINLIGNANKFTDSGNISLIVDCHSNSTNGTVSIKFTVVDSGIGIAAEKQQEIFNAFTQIDASSARHYGGIGLGLAICERLVAAMGGKIFLESTPGQGTSIGFDIQLSRSDEPIAQGADELNRLQIATLKVLMVEDDSTNSLVTRKYLERLGHRVTEASTGEKALEIFFSESFDLILLDISLPGIDGLTILETIRESADRQKSSMPVIAMSAHVFKEEVDQYIKAGMNSFLGKPFTLEELDQSIARVFAGEFTEPGEKKPITAIENLVVMDATVVESDIEQLGLDNVMQLVSLFIQSTGELLDDLKNAIRTNDFEAIESIAHKMTGAAGNFGLEKLTALLTEIETAGHYHRTLPESIFSRFDIEYHMALETLQNHVTSHQEVANSMSVMR